MGLRIRFYGRLADTIGPEIDLPTQGCSIGELRARIASDFSGAQPMLGRSRACIGDRIVCDERRIDGAETVEFLPPVSGG